MRQYLRDIGRVAMLTEEEELTLARLVQHRQRILEQHPAIEKPGPTWPGWPEPGA